jgi:hypothetical protein
MHLIKFNLIHDNGSLIQLLDILNLIEDNDWVWSVLDYYGFGEDSAGNVALSLFQNQVLHPEPGQVVSFQQLRAFARSILISPQATIEAQTIDCLIVAARAECMLETVPSPNHSRFADCEIVIEAFDGLEWSIFFKNPQLKQRILAFLRG